MDQIKDVADISQVIRDRRSIYPRQFSGARVDDQTILELLENANWAPNHKRTQPWRFQVFCDEGLNRLMDYFRDFYLEDTSVAKIKQSKLAAFEEKKQRTSHIVALILHRDPEKRIPEIEEVAAVACAVQNMHLSLSPLGLGGYWSTGNSTYAEQTAQFLGLEANESVMGFFYIGTFSGETPPSKRKPVEALTQWVRE